MISPNERPNKYTYIAIQRAQLFKGNKGSKRASLAAQMVKSACNVGDQVWFQGGEDPLEKEMETHSSILAWKIPRMEKTGRLQSMGSPRAGHDWATNTFKVIE